VAPLTVGLEEELILLDPASLDLCPRAAELLPALGDDPRYKLELPAAQLEILTPPCKTAREAVSNLAAARRDLVERLGGAAWPGAAGVHPFSSVAGPLNAGPRYERILDEYGWVARRQLVASLQVHIAVGGADRTLAVYNALRCYLPELAALAANAPVYDGEDTGLASVRPLICTLLPRQGVPPALSDWDELVEHFRWGASSGFVPEPAWWWWELRPHPRYGTLELRVPDAQTTLGQAAGVVALAQALVAWLAEAHDAGEPLPDAPTWRIEENRFSALRDGVEGRLASLGTGRTEPSRDRLHELIAAVEPVAESLGSRELLDYTRAAVQRNGAIAQREVFAESGARGVAAYLADEFLSGISAFEP
jgi:carboxylate-amine ligase